MKTLFIQDLVIGQKFTAEFQVIATEERKTKTNQAFMTFTVRDRTGQISGNKWGARTQDFNACAQGAIVSMTGTVEEYPKDSGVKQLNITEVYGLLDCDPSDFIPVAARSYEDLMDDMRRLVESIDDPWLKKLTMTILSSKDGYMWRNWPAAKSVHHAVKHGLMQHSVEVAQYAEAIAMVRDTHCYPEKINRSLVIAGALLHDIGKVYEYTETQNGAFDVGVGGLHGHIVLGVLMIGNAAAQIGEGFGEMHDAILHVLCSHHGTLEYGSPVTPMTPEAHIVHIADLASAKLYTDWDARQKHNGQGLYAKHIDGRAYCPKE